MPHFKHRPPAICLFIFAFLSVGLLILSSISGTLHLILHLKIAIISLRRESQIYELYGTAVCFIFVCFWCFYPSIQTLFVSCLEFNGLTEVDKLQDIIKIPKQKA